MPLTIAHPAAVIPIRHRLVFSALVIGSMVPDFSKFLSLSRGVTLGHTVPSVFWFCLPVGLISFLLFQHLLKKPLFLLLPASHQKRLVPWLNPLPLRTVRQWGLVIASIIIGAFTHLFWDDFTHAFGWPVQTFSFLRRNLFLFQGHFITTYELLQHASAVVGLIFLAACYVRFYRKAALHPLPPIPVISPRMKSILCGSAIALAILAGIIFANAHPYPMISWSFLARRAAVASMAAFGFELVLFSLLCRLYFKNFSPVRADSQ